MMEKKLKYQKYLQDFKNCPPVHFAEVDRYAYRWTKEMVTSNDFLPINIMHEPPPRILDDSDKMCMAYGLSMFDALTNSLSKYRKEYKKRRSHQKVQFIQDRGSCIAELILHPDDGLADQPNRDNFGHFTFYEYQHTHLENKIISLYKVFLENGDHNIE
jgi:hypothetical protein